MPFADLHCHPLWATDDRAGAASLSSASGRMGERLVRRLLDKGVVAAVASDLHRPAAASRLLDEGLDALQKAVGDSALTLLLDTNPRRVLRGQPL